MTETMVPVNGVDLCVQTFGVPGAPAILLMAGAAASMDWWDAGFCERLAAGGRLVIRYDNRDTGRSSSCPPGKPDYTGADLIADAVGLIDAVAGGRAHLAGISMGGGLGQHIAVHHAERVSALTLISTSSGRGGDLPPVAERLKAALADPPPEPDWADRAAVIDYLVAAQRPFAGPDSFDEAYVRAVVSREVDRTVSIEAASKNHWIMVAGDDGGDGDGGSRLAEIAVPTLVIHGTEDPLFPPGHGIALANEIPGAELLLLDGTGHQPPPSSTWDRVVPAMLRLAAR
ncbi:MAG TPA: alpha/beta hydrolase [Mycobacteriales bacterium]|nr:alpha/beta hydrolase [Mycobacteriales bacterium]